MHGMTQRYYGCGLTFYGFQDVMCRCLWFSCHLERDFRVLGSQYNFQGFGERILCVRVLIGLVDYFRFFRLFIGFTNVFNGLVRLDSEWSAQFYRLAVRGEEEREFCVQGLHGFSWRYYGLWLTVQGFTDDVCRVVGFVCRLERDFRVCGSRYKIFIVCRERNLCVRLSMRLVDFLGF